MSARLRPGDNAGKRLGWLMVRDPEIGHPPVTAEDLRAQQLIGDYLTAGEPSCSEMLRRLEDLKFDAIIMGCTLSELLG